MLLQPTLALEERSSASGSSSHIQLSFIFCSRNRAEQGRGTSSIALSTRRWGDHGTRNPL